MSAYSAIGASALPPKADMCGAMSNVCFGPKADMLGDMPALLLLIVIALPWGAPDDLRL